MSPEAERGEAERDEAMRAEAKILPMIIAIDGPAGSGKSTLASKLAEHFGLHFIDTGLLYRAVALRLGDLGHMDPDAVDEAVAVGIAHDLRAEDIASPRLRGEGIGGRASQVAAMPGRARRIAADAASFGARGQGQCARRAGHRHGRAARDAVQAFRDRQSRGAGEEALRGVAETRRAAYTRARSGRAARA